MFNENDDHGKFFCIFLSLLSSRSQLDLKGGHCRSPIPNEIARPGKSLNYQKINNVSVLVC